MITATETALRELIRSITSLVDKLCHIADLAVKKIEKEEQEDGE